MISFNSLDFSLSKLQLIETTIRNEKNGDFQFSCDFLKASTCKISKGG